MLAKFLHIFRILIASPFIYSAIVKFTDLDFFLLQTNSSQVIPEFFKPLLPAIPYIDIILFLLLILTKKRSVLFVSLFAYLGYTIFLFMVVNYSRLTGGNPCGCQGLFTFLSIGQHIFLNIIMILLNILLLFKEQFIRFKKNI